MDITKQTVEQLKSLAYDQMVELERIQTNLRILNTEIEKRKNEPVKKVEEEKVV
jgi:hypothetical protein